MATIIFYRRVAMNELASFGYLNYKNYIIEFIKGDLKKNFLEKSQEYKEKFDELLEKEILQKIDKKFSEKTIIIEKIFIKLSKNYQYFEENFFDSL